mmetsp:Transcript_26286/g.56368  ORF Transcript_26286/g.56368 Transcript_26286/m.56368 type:complete len:352 (-) Transcript_26286:289-1344(-)|eukprot:CAMPEP_0201118840 /NCGR_PEP_ID=MMETSP0850-20130426/3023_1 /ASSEMBLY_ACC=CAM_ASM_000622 /TAXON_ID=183588 /ORGANISM="Pseudo-nitzschia fraudulenta, Strain WWA7" /LENGTH=351 /DNA_ID=CAMNT_0047384287 /DNA_START=127 /DNA_END=1182 /DNA_ORIENTATION=-
MSTKIKRLPTQVFIGAYQGVTRAGEIERLITNEEWDAHSIICTNMAIATKDIAGCTRIRELGNPAGLEAAASGAILGGLIGGMSQLMVGGNSKRPSVLAIANDETLSEEEKVLAFSKRPSIVAQVADHNVTRMDKSRLEKISASLVPGSSAIVCVFDEVLVQQSVYETKMKDHKTDMDDLTDHVTSKIHEQLRNGNDVAFHVVVDDATGEISWTRTVIGDEAIQVREIVLSHDSMALEEMTTVIDGDGNEKELATDTIVMTPEAISTARTLLRDSVCAYEVTHEVLVDNESSGLRAGDQIYEAHMERDHADGGRTVLNETSKKQGATTTYEKKIVTTEGDHGTQGSIGVST